MGGLGSGISGGAGDGVYIRIVADADEADQNLSKLEGSVDNVTHSFQQMENAGQGVTTSMGEITATSDDLSGGLEDVDMANLKAMAGMTMMVSALNQVTGGIYKTIGGLEAAGWINEDTARSWQENARMIELFTGPLEILISLEIMATMMGKPFLATLWAKVPAFGAVGASAMTAAAAIWAFLVPVMAMVLPVLAVVAVIVLLVMHWDKATEAMKKTMLPFMMILDLHKQLWDLTVGLTSSMGSLGDAFTDNPVTKLISKAGGVFD